MHRSRAAWLGFIVIILIGGSAHTQVYEQYDCTGQQLLDAGTVLINGQRVALICRLPRQAPATEARMLAGIVGKSLARQTGSGVVLRFFHF